ncbi:MAG: flavin reductase [Bacteroidia bacterium]|nr:flavin reductase family protein [Bacteroidia bacterium]MDW8015872.1 flavin reductase [Bacteroidia bacterium]
MISYTAEDLLRADRRWRINFVNSLIGAKNLHVLVTRSPHGSYNAAIFNSGLHIGSSPPYVGFLLRPTTTPRHTYQNLKSYPFATMNAVSINFYKEAHLTHKKFPYDVSEIEACGLSLSWRGEEDIPYLGESPLGARLRLVEEHLLLCNHTRLLVFAVEAVHTSCAPQSDGFLPLDELKLVAGSGCDAYWRMEYVMRLPLESS